MECCCAPSRWVIIKGLTCVHSLMLFCAVVTELDGLAKNPAPLGTAAVCVTSYLETRIKSHSLNLKIQTSRGNYLKDLLIRTETHANTDAIQKGDTRNMDDLILNVAVFQSEHFVDRSGLLGQREISGVSGGDKESAIKVLLVTFDRNLRLRARARGIEAADEKEMAAILGK